MILLKYRGFLMVGKIYFGNNDDLIDICMDNVFKAVFTRNTPTSQGALSKLISALISRDVTKLLSRRRA